MSLTSELLADLLVQSRDFTEVVGDGRGAPALRDGVNDFLGRDVSNHFILGKRAAAEATERGVETAAAGVEGGKDLRLRSGPGAVQVNSDLLVAGSVDHCGHDLLIKSGSAMPTVSAREIEPTSSAAILRTASTRRSMLQRS